MAACGSAAAVQPVCMEEPWDAESAAASTDSDAVPQQAGRRVRRVVGAAAALAALALAGSALLLRGSRPASDGRLQAADVFGGVVSEALQTSYDGSAAASTAASAATSVLAPKENLFDGNKCDDDEELHMGLCYKKCSLLTWNQYPFRTSAWSCCREHPCSFTNQKLNPKFCGGFDVSGDRAGNGCPHAPGACLTNEEMHLGVCYKKCSILTNGAYPHRVAAATCCKQEGLGCLNLFDTKTSQDFDVGGGRGDGDKSTPRDPHMPMASLTEASAAKS